MRKARWPQAAARDPAKYRQALHTRTAARTYELPVDKDSGHGAPALRARERRGGGGAPWGRRAVACAECGTPQEQRRRRPCFPPILLDKGDRREGGGPQGEGGREGHGREAGQIAEGRTVMRRSSSWRAGPSSRLSSSTTCGGREVEGAIMEGGTSLKWPAGPAPAPGGLSLRRRQRQGQRQLHAQTRPPRFSVPPP